MVIEILRAAVSVDGGVSTGGRVYADPGESNRSYGLGTIQGAVSHRLNAAVSHRIGEIETILFEGGVSAGYVLGRGDSETIHAGESHGHRADIIGAGFYEMKIAAGDRGANDLLEVSHRADGANDLLEAGGSTWRYEGIGVVEAAVIAWETDGLGTIRAQNAKAVIEIL